MAIVRTATAAVTLTDVIDGQSAVSAFLTNANHTFISSPTGQVGDAARTDFQTNVQAYVGGTELAYSGNATAGDGEFVIQDIQQATGFTFVEGADGTITCDAIVAPDAQEYKRSGTVIVTVAYNTGKFTGTIDLELSVTIVRDGADSTVINLIQSDHTFLADADGVLASDQDDVIVEFIVTGTATNVAITTKTNGGAFSAATVGTGSGQIAGYRLSQSDTFVTTSLPTEGWTTGSQIKIAPTNVGNDAFSYTMKVAGDQGQDVVSVAKLLAGRGAIKVDIIPSGPTTFRNNSGDPVTLTAVVTDATGEGDNVLTDGVGGFEIKYSWEYGDGSQVRVAAVNDPTVVLSGGVVADGNNNNFAAITAGPEVVPDTSAPISIRCDVTVTKSTS
jgi:hypothetical protein